MANRVTANLQTARWGGPNGKYYVSIEATLVIDTTANGGAAPDDLPASLFGLRKIVGPAVIVNDGEDKLYHAGPDYSGDSLLVGGGASQAFFRSNSKHAYSEKQGRR
jgi:hypothetical protein